VKGGFLVKQQFSRRRRRRSGRESTRRDAPDDVRLSDIEDRFVCKECGKRGADVWPDFRWHLKARA
jgi:hypothetical protein